MKLSNPESRVPAEVAGVGVGDLEAIRLGEREESARDLVHAFLERGVDTVSGELHEPDLVAGRGELVDERQGVARRFVGEERGDVDDRDHVPEPKRLLSTSNSST